MTTIFLTGSLVVLICCDEEDEDAIRFAALRLSILLLCAMAIVLPATATPTVMGRSQRRPMETTPLVEEQQRRLSRSSLSVLSRAL